MSIEQVLLFATKVEKHYELNKIFHSIDGEDRLVPSLCRDILSAVAGFAELVRGRGAN